MKYIKDISGISNLLSSVSIPAYVSVNTGFGIETIADFRILVSSNENWQKAQEEYVKYHRYYAEKDAAGVYAREIDSVKEIYAEEFHLSGSILDVGGAQGRLRHFLKDAELEHYVCIDPLPEAFEGFGKMQALLKAYPVLNLPLYFVAGFAEALPFRDETFDWVHMRSVLDHFADPVLAVKEAYRVLKPGGKILIGLSIKKGGWLRAIPKKPLLQRVFKKIIKLLRRPNKEYPVGAEDHTHDWSYEELIALLQNTGFKIVKEHRQKEPYNRVIYLSAGK